MYRNLCSFRKCTFIQITHHKCPASKSLQVSASFSFKTWVYKIKGQLKKFSVKSLDLLPERLKMGIGNLFGVLLESGYGRAPKPIKNRKSN